MICADCGAELVRKGGRWASRLAGGGWDYCCRFEKVDDAISARLVSADYHHIAGEEQRHWRKEAAGSER